LNTKGEFIGKKKNTSKEKIRMSQEQCQRPQQEAIKYGDVFTVQGELAEKTVTPRDAAMMQTAENAMLGHTQKGGAAAAMQSAAMRNVRAGLVDHNDMSDNAGDSGVSITATDLPGKRIIVESVGGQVCFFLFCSFFCLMNAIW
jgi:hypothetical protein